MAKQRTFKLEGPSAGAYCMAQSGEKATTDEGRALRVATLVHVYLQFPDEEHANEAARLIMLVASHGLEAASDRCTVHRTTTEPR